MLVDTEWKLGEWCREHPDEVKVPRVLGEHTFEIEGTVGKRAVLPHSLWRWQRPRDYYHALATRARGPASELAQRLGLRVALSAGPRCGWHGAPTVSSSKLDKLSVVYIFA